MYCNDLYSVYFSKREKHSAKVTSGGKRKLLIRKMHECNKENGWKNSKGVNFTATLLVINHLGMLKIIAVFLID